MSISNINNAEYWFVYYKKNDSNNLTATNIYSKSSSGEFKISIFNLVSNTEYCFRAVGRDASNPALRSEGSNVCFFTSGQSYGPLGVITHSPENVANNSATLKGEITDMGNASLVSYWFTYYKCSNPGNVSATGIQTKNSLGNIYSSVNGLEANTEYCYRAYAQNFSNAGEKAQGAEKRFTTSGSGNNNNNNYPDINVETLAPEDYTSNFAILKARIWELGGANRLRVWFVYYRADDPGALKNTYEQSYDTRSFFTHNLYNLTPNTRYCYRAMATDFYNDSRKNRENTVCFTTKSEESGYTPGNPGQEVGTPSYSICYRGVLVYTSISSTGAKTIWTKGITLDTPSNIQKYSTGDAARSHIDSLIAFGYSYNQCEYNPTQGQKYKYYYCEKATGACRQTNGTYADPKSCVTSLLTYKSGISTGMCYADYNSCSKVCVKSSGSTSGGGNTSGGGSQGGTTPNTTKQKYYYCKKESKECILTGQTYDSNSACVKALNDLIPNQTNGVCYTQEDQETCKSQCSGAPAQEQVQTTTPATPKVCNGQDMEVQTLDFTEIGSSNRKLNGKLNCAGAQQINLGFEYFGLSETAVSPKRIWTTNFPGNKQKFSNPISFSYNVENLEPNIIYCYRAMAQGTDGKIVYGNEICYPSPTANADLFAAYYANINLKPFMGFGDILTQQDNDKQLGKKINDLNDVYQKEKKDLENNFKKMQERKGFAKFMIGADYGAIKKINKYIESNGKRITEVNKMKAEFQNQSTQTLCQNTADKLNAENTGLDEAVKQSKKGFSLFGWLFMLFNL